VKVSELIGARLDYWVARAEELDGIEFGQDGKFHGSICHVDESGNEDWYIYSPSTDWSQGGPIIERELCPLVPYEDEKSAEGIWMFKGIYKCQLKGMGFVGEGKTILQAAMRCVVASKFGEEVPDE
jgi:hypothetical protein